MGEFSRTANKVSAIAILVNTLLAVFKLTAGVIAHSSAMISDAVHSASDVFSTFVVIIGIKMASKEPDSDHPYGHERMECVAAMLLSMVLIITGLGIGIKALNSLISGEYLGSQEPGVMALVAAIVSIIVKEAMYWYTRINAIRIDSSALMADAWHHRTDSISSIGALAGIMMARAGYAYMDAVASLIIFLFITKAAIDIFRDAMDKMVDHACDVDTQEEIRNCVNNVKGVIGIDKFKTRVFGNRIYVDIEISVDGDMSLKSAHKIAEKVHDDIERKFPKVKHIMVHVNPA